MSIANVPLDFNGLGRGRIASPTSAPPTTHSPTTPELTAISGCPFFAGADEATLHSLSQACSIRQVARGAALATEGSVIGQAFLVLRGRVRAVRRGESGREITLELFRPGDLIADAFLAPDQPLTNDWEAVEQTLLLVIPRDALLAHVRLLPELGIQLGRLLVARLNHSKDMAVGLALSDVQDRVIEALRLLARQEGESQVVAEGTLIRQRPTQQELANRIGACRETVSRIVSDLTRRGLVTPQGRSLLLSKRLESGER
jgi:CRP/FNR family transcriptional regulator, cyclic AMP receptor protein